MLRIPRPGNAALRHDRLGVGIRLVALPTLGGRAELAEFVVIAFSIPVLLGMLLATWRGIALAARLNDPALVVLSAVSILCGGGMVIMIFLGRKSGVPDYAMVIVFGIYTTANIAIPAWWFIVGRRRYRRRSAQNETGRLSPPL